MLQQETKKREAAGEMRLYDGTKACWENFPFQTRNSHKNNTTQQRDAEAEKAAANGNRRRRSGSARGQRR